MKKGNGEMDKERHIYFYRLTSDSGNAPCVYEGTKYAHERRSDLLSLTCCKGGDHGLRHTVGKRFKGAVADGLAEVWLVGTYRNHKNGKDHLLYIARVTSIMTMEDYAAAHPERADCIYVPNQSKNLQRRKNWNRTFHPKDGGFKTRDLAGGYALLSGEFCYLGKEHLQEPIDEQSPIHDLMPKNRGHKPWHDDENKAEVDRAMAFIEGMMKKYQGKEYPPTDQIIGCGGCGGK